MSKVGIWIKEEYVDKERRVVFGDSGVYETGFENRGELFRHLQKEYGKCVSKMYVDRAEGKAKAIGWVFEKREQYEDTGKYGREAEYYTREVWVSRHRKPPKSTVKYYY